MLRSGGEEGGFRDCFLFKKGLVDPSHARRPPGTCLPGCPCPARVVIGKGLGWETGWASCRAPLLLFQFHASAPPERLT